MGGNAVPGEADWLEILRREVLLAQDVEQFKRFNPHDRPRFWLPLLMAFRVLEDASGTGATSHLADVHEGFAEIENDSRREMRDSLTHLRKALKETGKAITAIRRQYRAHAENCAARAEAELGQFTRSHVVAPCLRPPIDRVRLEAAKAVLEKQAAEIKSMPKANPSKVRRNNREHAFRAIVHLAHAYQMSGWPLTFNADSNSAQSFPSLLSLFYQVVCHNLPVGRFQLHSTEWQFLRYAADNRGCILERLGAVPTNGF